MLLISIPNNLVAQSTKEQRQVHAVDLYASAAWRTDGRTTVSQVDGCVSVGNVHLTSL